MMATLGDELRALRRAAGLTQEQLEEASGVNQGTISALENNRQQRTSVENLNALARTLNADPLRLLQAMGVQGVSAYAMRDDDDDGSQLDEHFPLVARLRSDPEFMREYMALGPENVDEGLVELVKTHLRALRRSRA